MIFLLPSIINDQPSTPFAPRIPPLAWVAIAIILLFTLAVNIAMIALLRAKARPDLTRRQPKPGGFVGSAQNLAKMGEVMRDPFAKERTQLDELSKLVRGLDDSKPADRSQDSPKTKVN
jgi:hypothetical protein